MTTRAQPRTDTFAYRNNVHTWRVWNVTRSEFPPFALVAMARDQGGLGFGNRLARTAYDMHPTVPRHKQDALLDDQITFEAFSGPQADWTNDLDEHIGIVYSPGFKYAQTPESYLALFERPVPSDKTGLATQQWPVLTRLVGDASTVPDSWPRYAVPDLDNFGVKVSEEGPFQILAIDPNPLPDCALVWITPRQRPYRDAWAIGAVDLVEGVGGWQEIKAASVAVNSPGGADILTIEDGRIIVNRAGIYHGTVTAIAAGDPPDSDGAIKLGFVDPQIEYDFENDLLAMPRSEATGSYAWLPQGTDEAQSHSHAIGLSGGASDSFPWDRTITTLTYGREFRLTEADMVPWQARLMWDGIEGETLTRLRYQFEYVGPIIRSRFSVSSFPTS